MNGFAAALLLIALGLGLLWVIVPALYGLPPISARPERVRRALEISKLRPGETLYDLGCGHGQVLILAAREFGARAVGIDAGPVQCLVSWVNAQLSRAGSRVRIELGSFFGTDLSKADVVYAYLTSRYAARLQAKLERELQPGARVVTISFSLPDWEPAFLDREQLIFLYTK